jgi:hypothetical protein
METWEESLENETKYYHDLLNDLEQLRPTCQALDRQGIDATGGSVWRASITIKNADEGIVPKLVAIKTAPVVKFFHEHDGVVGYTTKIGDILIQVVPDPTKYVCKVTRTEVKKQVVKDEVSVSFKLTGDCDPLFFEEATIEEVTK